MVDTERTKIPTHRQTGYREGVGNIKRKRKTISLNKFCKQGTHHRKDGLGFIASGHEQYCHMHCFYKL